MAKQRGWANIFEIPTDSGFHPAAPIAWPGSPQTPKPCCTGAWGVVPTCPKSEAQTRGVRGGKRLGGLPEGAGRRPEAQVDGASMLSLLAQRGGERGSVRGSHSYSPGPHPAGWSLSMAISSGFQPRHPPTTEVCMNRFRRKRKERRLLPGSHSSIPGPRLKDYPHGLGPKTKQNKPTKKHKEKKQLI